MPLRVPTCGNVAVNASIDCMDFGRTSMTRNLSDWAKVQGPVRVLHSPSAEEFTAGLGQPFVFTGHIGLVPQGQRVSVEPWLKEHGKDRVLVEAFLVEGEPLDGASGAPVFVRRSIKILVTPRDEDNAVSATVEGSIWCLGLQSDAYQGKASKDLGDLLKIVDRCD